MARTKLLWIQPLADQQPIFHWDRGPDHVAANKTVQAIVDFLKADLAAHIYAEMKQLGNPAVPPRGYHSLREFLVSGTFSF